MINIALKIFARYSRAHSIRSAKNYLLQAVAAMMWNERVAVLPVIGGHQSYFQKEWFLTKSKLYLCFLLMSFRIIPAYTFEWIELNTYFPLCIGVDDIIWRLIEYINKNVWILFLSDAFFFSICAIKIIDHFKMYIEKIMNLNSIVCLYFYLLILCIFQDTTFEINIIRWYLFLSEVEVQNMVCTLYNMQKLRKCRIWK